MEFMGFWRQCKEGLRLTFSEVGWSGVVVGTGTAIALLLQWMQGTEAAFGELMTYIKSVGWGFAGLMVVFLFRVLRTVPIQELEDKNSRLEAEVEMLRKQIDKASKARRLSADQQARITEVIRDWKHLELEQMHVVYSPITPEAQDFAADIGDAIAASGVKCVVHAGGSSNMTPRLEGFRFATVKNVPSWRKHFSKG